MHAAFLGNVILKGKLECLTGLHIGGFKEKLEIGGVDAPVLRDPNSNYPYIPGSSLKGRMRSLLAFALNKADQDPNPEKYDPTCPLQRVFGTSREERNHGPTRLIVRDAWPDDATVDMWKRLDSELLFTEYKPENAIDRLTAKANPRYLERVVKGSVFDVEFVFGIFHPEDGGYFMHVTEALRLLEHSALGRSISRGYGQVLFSFAEPFLVLNEDYRLGTQQFEEASRPNSHDFFRDKFVHRISDFNSEYINNLLLPVSVASASR